MNPPPSSPEPHYQRRWEEEELSRLLQNTLPKLAERLNEEIANNPELSARCIDPVAQEAKADDTQSPHTNGVEEIPEENAAQNGDCPKVEEAAEPLSMTEMPTEAPSQTASAQQHNQENIPLARGRFYSTSDAESPEPLLAPPSSPVAKHSHYYHTNGTE